MRKPVAAAASALFFALAPGTVAIVLPWWISRWQLRSAPDGWSWLAVPVRVFGAALIVAGAVVLISAFIRFVVEGLGTPAPVAPPKRLVIGGLYRHVRNPMYVAVLASIIGQALLLFQVKLFWYAAIVAAALVAFVHLYEEPTLTRRFGADYRTYLDSVPRWWPRLRPWQPPTTLP
jgi:protein-S-isoprenylcysteine O-methyltransferase Ste14